MHFFLSVIPPTATHQMKKWRVVSGKPVSYEPAEVRSARAKLTAHLGQHRPNEPLDGAIAMSVKWCFPAGGRHNDGEPRITKPDTDNLQKLLKDCMTDCGFWHDDAQVAEEIVRKVWADQPGIFIRLEPIQWSGPC